MADSLQLVVAYRQVPKRGLSAEQCEDAWAANPSAGRFSVADGATDSYASGRFARLLAEGFVGESGPRTAEELGGWARGCAEAWSESTPTEGLPWYKQEKARLGAHCTFLGVQLEARDDGPSAEEEAGERDPTEDGATGASHGESPSATPLGYRAFAVGDVCLFHVRRDDLIELMPVSRPEDFGVQPALVATSRTYPGPGVEALVEWTGTLEAGDRLYLASDAVAHWLLVSVGQGGSPWGAIDEASADEFADLVESLRDNGRMRNDDVTVVSVAVEVPDSPSPDSPAPPEGEEAPRPHSPSARRQIERAAAVSLAVGALGVGIALVCGPRAGQAASDSLKDLA